MATTLTPRMKPKTERTVGAPRKTIDPNSTELRHRFALHLRALLDSKGWGASELHRQIILAGLTHSLGAVHSWLSGKRIPEAQDLETLAGIVIPGEDWRQILPPPLPKRRRK